MTAYLDNNIFIDIESGSYSLSDLLCKIDNEISKIYYSASHLQEAREITGSNSIELTKRLNGRFETITKITNNNYLYHELPSNKVYELIEKPSIVFETINNVPFGQNTIKEMVNLISEEQRCSFRTQLDIDLKKINNYSHIEVIQQINMKSDFLGGYSFLELIQRAIDLHPQGTEFGLHNRIAGIFEFLDLFGYWKDKYNEKSNYARLWDSSHTYFSSFCDYFISNDKRTRNKARVVFEIYKISTKIISSNGIN
jgi:hypothetical protein